MELDTKESGMSKKICEMVKEPKYGLMVLFMKDIGEQTKLTVVVV